MAMIDCGGEGFNVEVEGPEGAPALLFSNSLSCTLSMWDEQVRALAGRFRVVRYDARGQGGSVVSAGPYRIEQLGRDALGVLDALGIERAHFCGLSMGGMVGQWVLAHAPGRVMRAVLANTAARMHPPALWDGRIAMVREGGMAAVVEATVQRWFPPAFLAGSPAVVERMRAMVRGTPAAGYIACCEAIRDMDQLEAIRSVSTPTLVVVGAHDTATTPADGELIHGSIAGSRVVSLPTGHISAVEMPGAFTRELEGVLAVRVCLVMQPHFETDSEAARHGAFAPAASAL